MSRETATIDRLKSAQASRRFGQAAIGVAPSAIGTDIRTNLGSDWRGMMVAAMIVTNQPSPPRLSR
jgi:hypothetical protein